MTNRTRNRTFHLEVEVSRDELKAIDEYRFQFRMPSRSAAARALLESGMASGPGVDKKSAN